MSNIVSDFPRLPAEAIQELAQFPAAVLSDAAGRRGALNGRIKPLDNRMKLIGTALTVDIKPGDNLMIHAALALAKPGDVLVIDGKSYLDAAVMGSIMVTISQKVGVVGVVIDGAIRDSQELIEMQYPVFAAGINANGPTKTQAGRIGHPVSVGGVTVCSGDLVVADADGVVVIPAAQVAGLADHARAKLADEARKIAEINAGDVHAKWLSDALQQAGVIDAKEMAFKY